MLSISYSFKGKNDNTILTILFVEAVIVVLTAMDTRSETMCGESTLFLDTTNKNGCHKRMYQFKKLATNSEDLLLITLNMKSTKAILPKVFGKGHK